MNWTVFQRARKIARYRHGANSSIQYLYLKVKLTEEGTDREEENSNDHIDYKSRSLKIFPRINRRQKKPPKFVAIPLSRPQCVH